MEKIVAKMPLSPKDNTKGKMEKIVAKMPLYPEGENGEDRSEDYYYEM
ncbi:MAG: hypothetical protein IPJ02_06650 [Chitinophagaceae bacterium]|nr:hypothetical protein [Chitinophagaceae bacterium]